MSTNMALIMTVESTCAIEDKQLFRKQYTKFARKRSLARNKPSYSVGDQIFWLKPSILHPYPGRLLQLQEMIYHYRHFHPEESLKMYLEF